MNEILRATLPIAGSEHAKDIDTFYFFVFYLRLFFFVIIAWFTIYFFKTRLKLKWPPRGDHESWNVDFIW